MRGTASHRLLQRGGVMIRTFLFCLFLIVLADSPALAGLEDLALERTYAVTIGENATMQKLLERGHFDRTNEGITEYAFPIKTRGDLTITLVRGAKLFPTATFIRTSDLMKELEKQGLVPISAGYLLALGAQFPDLQRGKVIVALGSVWEQMGTYREEGREVQREMSPPLVSYLYGSLTSRTVDLCQFRSPWDPKTIFAVVAK